MTKINTNLVIGAGSISIVAGLFLAVSLASPGVREQSRRIGSPEYQQKMQKVLALSDAGHAALYRKNYRMAEQKLRQSLALDNTGGNVGTWADLGRALDEQGRSEEAYSAYRNAYDSPTRGGYSNFPNDVETLTQYAMMCEDHGQHEAAVKAYNKATEELNPRLTEVSLSVPADPQKTSEAQLRTLLTVVRGLTMGEEKNLPGGRERSSEALELFQQAAQDQPNDARVQYYLGYSLQKAGQPNAAQTAYQKAARLDTEGTVKAAATKSLQTVGGTQ